MKHHILVSLTLFVIAACVLADEAGVRDENSLKDSLPADKVTEDVTSEKPTAQNADNYKVKRKNDNKDDPDYKDDEPTNTEIGYTHADNVDRGEEAPDLSPDYVMTQHADNDTDNKAIEEAADKADEVLAEKFKALEAAKNDGNNESAAEETGENASDQASLNVQISGEKPELVSQKPAETAADKPAENVADQAVPAPEAASDKPAETPADKPAETPADKPAENTTDQAAPAPEAASDKPAETPADKPAETPADKPAENAADQAAPAPEAASDKPAETTADKPADIDAERAAETSTDQPSKTAEKTESISERIINAAIKAIDYLSGSITGNLDDVKEEVKHIVNENGPPAASSAADFDPEVIKRIFGVWERFPSYPPRIYTNYRTAQRPYNNKLRSWQDSIFARY